MESTQHGRMFHAVFATAPLGIAIADPAGRFLDVNQAFLNMLGYSREETLRLTFMEVTHPDDRAETLRMIQKVRNGEMNSYQVEKRYVGRGGGSIWTIARITVQRNEDGAIQYWLGILEDITARRLAEKERQRLADQLRQAQKMEAIGTLAGGIAHDFNNLLMGIQGNISLLMLDKTADHRDMVYLKNMEKSVMRASELTRQILGFARGGKYDVKATDLNALIEKTAEMFGRTRKEITIRRNFQKGLWAIEVDQTQLQQVLLNLLINAWQAMPGGGEVVLDTANVDVDAGSPDRPPDAAPGQYIRVQVTDTGVGMDRATQARIFEPFFTTRGKGQGTGLGLSSAFGIVKSHNGFMTVRSKKDRGSTFSVFLPAAPGAGVRAQGPADAVLPGVKTILLVEDEEMVADIGRQMLERMGYRPLVARTGEEALALYAQRRAEIDLVILDMIMPGLGGGAVFDRIRTINPKAAVLLSSGYSLNGQALEILKRGCRGFIQKPFNLEQLSQKIREILFSVHDQTG
jgi:two-component system cell cycle sensor histidine kinase/response regulator CckA